MEEGDGSSGRYHSPPDTKRRGVKAGLTESQWKKLLRERAEKRVKDQRTKILAEIRERKMHSVSSVLADLVAEEDALRRDERRQGIPVGHLLRSDSDTSESFVLHKRDGLPDSQSTDEDEDFDLTDDERLELLLYLEETLYRTAVEEEEAEAARCQYEDVEADEDAFIADLIESAMEHTAGKSCKHLTAGASHCLEPEDEDLMHLEDDFIMPHKFGTPSEQVNCPICNSSTLLEQSGFIYCHCGFRLDTANGLRLKHLTQRLQDSNSMHAAHCSMTPTYAVRSDYGLNALCLACDACGELQVVI